MSEATTIRCDGLDELNMQIIALGEQGFRIIAVLDLGYNHMYTIVAQKDALPDYQQFMTDLGNVIQSAVYEAGQPAQ